MFSPGIVEKPRWDSDYHITGNELLMAVYGESWQTCRELLHDDLDRRNNDMRVFLRPTLPLEEIAKFILHIEKLMGIKPLSVLQYAGYKIKWLKQNADGSPDYEKLPKGGKIEKDFVIYNNAICITPAAFWCEHPVKMAFLTAAIKMADWEESIDFARLTSAEALAEYLIEIDDDWSYFQSTRVATRRFLSGHTKVCRSRKKSSGWVSIFDPLDKKDDEEQRTRTERLLQKP